VVHCRMGGEEVSPERGIVTVMPGVEQEKILGVQETVSKEAYVVSLNSIAANRVNEYCEILSARRGVDGDKLSRVKDFFTSEDTLKKVVSLYSDLLQEEYQITTEKQACLTGHLSFVIERAIDQHLDNPEQYVSHGFDHSLRVIENVNQIMSDIPEVVQKVEDDYEITESEAKFLLRNVALFHDFGYPESESKQVGKTMHSVMGADIVSNGGVIVNGQSFSVKEVFLKILNSDRGGLMFRDFRDSILMHNADKIKQFYDGKIITSKGNFLFRKDDVLTAYSLVEDMGYKVLGISICVDSQEAVEGVRMQTLTRFIEMKKLGRFIEIEDMAAIPQIEVKETKKRYKGRGFGSKNQNKILGLEYTNVVLVEEPLKAIIRLADNMDMTAARLSAIQKEFLFLAYNLAVGDEKSSFYQENQEIELELKKVKEGRSIGGLREIIVKHISEREVNRLRDDLNSENSEQMIQLVTKGKLDQFAQIQRDVLRVYDVDECMAYWRKFIVDEIALKPEIPLIDEATKIEVKKAVVKLDSLQLRHFGGCYAVEEVQLSEKKIEIKVDQDIFDGLNKIRVKEEIRTTTGLASYIEMGVGEYQIRRMVEALRSVRIREDSGLSIYVNDKVYFAA